VASVRERTISTERPPIVGEVSANFCGYTVSRGLRYGSPTAVFSPFYTGIATFSSKYLLNFTHKAERTPLQTHYLSENLVAWESNPDFLICSQELWPVVACSCDPATWRPGIEDDLRLGVLVLSNLRWQGVRSINMGALGRPGTFVFWSYGVMARVVSKFCGNLLPQ
jgi:hypothetical protein